jgi:hypothetical protein
MSQKNNRKYGPSHEKKTIEDTPPAFANHQKGSLDYSVNFVKQMGGAINYNPQVGYFFPPPVGTNPNEVEFLKAKSDLNINWVFRCKGLPGSRP